MDPDLVDIYKRHIRNQELWNRWTSRITNAYLPAAEKTDTENIVGKIV
jgi:hypothetical protein